MVVWRQYVKGTLQRDYNRMTGCRGNGVVSWGVLPNVSRLSCGALKKDSFPNLRAPPASGAC